MRVQVSPLLPSFAQFGHPVIIGTEVGKCGADIMQLMSGGPGRRLFVRQRLLILETKTRIYVNVAIHNIPKPVFFFSKVENFGIG